MENEYGAIIAYERRRVGLDANEMCRGLCPRTYMQNLEPGKRNGDRFLANAMIQRMGVSVDKYIHLLETKEKKILMLWGKITEEVDRNQAVQAKEHIEEFWELTGVKKNLKEQLCLLAEAVLAWKSREEPKRVREKISLAWRLTKLDSDIRKLEKPYLTFTEWSLTILDACLAEEEEAENALSYYEDILYMLDKRVEERDRVKFYPQVAYRTAKILLADNMMEDGRMQRAEAIMEKCFELLRRQGSLLYLMELSELYIEMKWRKKQLSAEEYKRCRDHKQLAESLKWLYQEYGIERESWTWTDCFGMSEMYLCKDVIRGRRIGFGMSQELLSEGICDPVSISRIEQGKHFPKRKVLVQLLKRVNFSGERDTLTAQLGEVKYHTVTEKLNVCYQLEQYKEAKAILEELERKIKRKSLQAQQYICSNLAQVKYQMKEITAQEYYRIAEEALHLTMPEADNKKLEKWCFTRAEGRCIVMMAQTCEKMGKEDYVLELLNILKNSYEKQSLYLKYFNTGYKAAAREIGNLLGNKGEYKAAMEVERHAIKLALELQQSYCMDSLLYDYGWNIEQIIAGQNKKRKKEESLSYMKASYILTVFLKKENLDNFVSEHIQQVYNSLV